MKPILISEDNANELIYAVLDKLMYKDKEIYKVIPRYKIEGRDPVPGDGLETRELVHAVLHLSNIQNAYIFMPERKNDIFACIAECLWVLAGRSDVEFLKIFLPRADQFTDDGIVWRAGYGQRIRKWCIPDSHGNVYIDQLKGIVKHLQNNIHSRQAIMSIWDPGKDLTERTIYKDYPCCNWIHFLVRDGKLDLSLTIRSNDILWGLSQINLQEWAFIQRVVASLLRVGEGNLVILSDSLHIYENSYEKAEAILDNRISYDYDKFTEVPLNIPNLVWLDYMLERYMLLVQRVYRHLEAYEPHTVSSEVCQLSLDNGGNSTGMYPYLIIPMIGLYYKAGYMGMAEEFLPGMNKHSILGAAVAYQIERKRTGKDRELLTKESVRRDFKDA